MMASPSLDELMADPVLGPRLRVALGSHRWSEVLPGDSGSHNWTLRILKYRPARRVSLQVSQAGKPSAIWIMKIWYNRRGETIRHRLDCLARALGPSAVRTPVPSFYEPKAHALVYPFVPGEPLTTILRRGASRWWSAPLARSLAALHGVELGGLGSWGPDKEIALLRDRVEACGDGARRIAMNSLVARLEASAPSPSAEGLIHRDLYDAQVLVQPDGGLYLIDLDDMARGDPMLDLGNFAAHLRLISHWERRPEKLLRVQGRLLREYARATATPAAELSRRFTWYESAALGRLAAIQLQRGRPEMAEKLAKKGREILDGDLNLTDANDEQEKAVL